MPGEMKRQWAIRIAVLAVGFGGVVAQVLVLREMVVTFYGNELSLGVMLACWLGWTGLGSLVLGRLTRRVRPQEGFLAGLMVAGALVLVVTVVVARLAKVLVGLPEGAVLGFLGNPLAVLKGIVAFLARPGETVAALAAARTVSIGQVRPFGLMLSCSLGVLGPFCLVNGLIFPVACRVATRMEGGGGVGRVYLAEALGAAAGGAAFSFLLVGLVEPVPLAAGVGVAWCCAAGLLRQGGPEGRSVAGAMPAAIGFLALALLLATGKARSLNDAIEAGYWLPFEDVVTRESRYGRVSLQAGMPGGQRQWSLYHSGVLSFSYPDPPVAEGQVHLAMLEHPGPRRVLLLGGALGGAVREVLKHPSVERVWCVELDPVVVRLVEENFPPDALSALRDRRVELVVSDGRAFLKRTDERFDVVLCSEGPPQTAQNNRFYTAEFFREVAEVLEPGGVFSFRAAAGHNYIPAEVGRLLASLKRTLETAFAEVVVFPGATCTFLASRRPGSLTYDLMLLSQRMAERGVETSYVDASIWEADLVGGRLEELQAALRSPAPLNHDLRPACYYYEAQRWSALQRARAPGAARRLLDLGRLLAFLHDKPWLAPSVFLGLLALLALVGGLVWGRARDGALSFSIASTGLIEMGVEFSVLLGFQVVYGYVYHYLGVLVASFMVGLAVGAWGAGEWCRRGRASWARMLAVQLAVCAYPLVLLGFLMLATRAELGSVPELAAVVFSAVALVAGLVGGLQFPLAVALHGQGERSAGALYGFDLFGSCLGALGVSSVMVPLIGLTGVCWVLSALGGLGLIALVAARPTWRRRRVL